MFWRLICILFALNACATDGDIGARYVGAKYVLDPLGEGFGYDPDPVIRDDAFDCTTFVETVLADGDVDKLTRIRYKDGIVDWRARNHFIETDWIDNNSDVIENVSRVYGPTSIRNVHIDKRAWARATHGINIDVAPRDVYLEYIAYDDLNAIDNDVPLVVLYVVGPREDTGKLATDIAVVHMGFLLPGGQIFRHASTGRGVVDDNFAQYVAKRKKMKNNIGVVFLGIKK